MEQRTVPNTARPPVRQVVTVSRGVPPGQTTPSTGTPSGVGAVSGEPVVATLSTPPAPPQTHSAPPVPTTSLPNVLTKLGITNRGPIVILLAATGLVFVGLGAWLAFFRRKKKTPSRSSKVKAKVPTKPGKARAQDADEEDEEQPEEEAEEDEEGLDEEAGTKDSKGKAELPDYGPVMSLKEARQWLENYRTDQKWKKAPNALPTLLEELGKRYELLPEEQAPGTSKAETDALDDMIMELDYDRYFLIGFLAGLMRQHSEKMIPMIASIIRSTSNDLAQLLIYTALFVSSDRYATQLGFRLWSASGERLEGLSEKQILSRFNVAVSQILETISNTLAVVYFGMFHAIGAKEFVQQALNSANDLYQQLAKTPQQLLELNRGTKYVLNRFKQSSKAAEAALAMATTTDFHGALIGVLQEVQGGKKSLRSSKTK